MLIRYLSSLRKRDKHSVPALLHVSVRYGLFLSFISSEIPGQVDVCRCRHRRRRPAEPQVTVDYQRRVELHEARFKGSQTEHDILKEDLVHLGEK